MYISFVHHYVPKFFGIAAFVVNPIFVFLIFTDKKSQMGNYKYLLLCFACFNIIYSLADIFIPIGAHGYGKSFEVFISDGYFEEASSFNQYLVSLRCALISCSYAILVIHFLYRYLIIFKFKWMNKNFHWFILLLFVFLAVHYIVWVEVCDISFRGELQNRMYIRDDFFKSYGTDVLNITIIFAMYGGVEPEIIHRTYIGIGLLVFISSYSVTLYIILGYKITKELNKNDFQMSQNTAKLQKLLLKALAVQTVIPIFVSFVPCFIGWFSPVLGLELGSKMNYLVCIALAAFPFLDPIAIIVFLPALRGRLTITSIRNEFFRRNRVDYAVDDNTDNADNASVAPQNHELSQTTE